MGSVIETIKKYSQRVSKIKRYEEQKKNADRIKNIESRFTMLIYRLSNLSKIIEYSKTNFGFQPTDQLNTLYLDVISEAKKAVTENGLYEDAVTNFDNKFQKALSVTKNEWKQHFVSVSNSINGLNSIVQVVDPELVSKTKDDIYALNSFSEDFKKYECLKNSVDEINKLINTLELDNEIKNFLIKVGNGTAMLSNVNEKILKWVYANGLSNKLRLMFIGK